MASNDRLLAESVRAELMPADNAADEIEKTDPRDWRWM